MSWESAEERPRFVATVTENCTGCRACVDFCLVDCIDESPGDATTPGSIQIRHDECIGCRLCAKVCEQLALNAIRMVPVAQILDERVQHVVLHPPKILQHPRGVQFPPPQRHLHGPVVPVQVRALARVPGQAMRRGKRPAHPDLE